MINYYLLNAIHYFASGATVNCPTGTTNEIAGCNGSTGLPQSVLSTNSTQGIFEIVFGVMGSVAVIVILVSAIQLIISQGSPDAITKARNTLIYAAVGLAVAISAEIIVSAAINRL